jgi:hypothetical protein
VDKGAKKEKDTKKKTCKKVGGLWIDLKHYPLLAEAETQEESTRKSKSEDSLKKGKEKRGKRKAA